MNKLKTIIPIAIIAAIGGIIRKLSFIEFQVPPLVEGPRVVFFIPLPEFLHKIPFAMETANGGYGLPVTITVVTTWFLILFTFQIFRYSCKNYSLSFHYRNKCIYSLHSVSYSQKSLY